jgi:hypothetical protein
MDQFVGRMEVLADPSALAQRVAEWMTATALAAKGRFRVALSGGSTPKMLYGLLASDEFRDRFPWQRVSWFWGDERFVPYDHPESNYRMTREAMLAKVPVPPENIHPVPTDGNPRKPLGATSGPCRRPMERRLSTPQGRSSTSCCWDWVRMATPHRCSPETRCWTSASVGWPRSLTDGPRSASP